jgi:molybdopterin-guanine dinucleotide biosynthesis protein A
MDTDKLLGVVLCGGESRRMGHDKGLLDREGKPWAIRMGEKLAPWPIPVVWSINTRQRAAYAAILPPEQLIEDALDLPGPLDGLFSVHARFPDRDLLLLACDMPDLDGPAVGDLLDAYQAQNVSREKIGNGPAMRGGPASVFFVYTDAGGLQPFCAIYTAAGLVPGYRLARAGVLRDFSLQSLLKSGLTTQIIMRNPGAFRNYNTK